MTLATTLATMFDDVTTANLPEGGDGYLAYLNGGWDATPDKVRARFPGKPVKSISVNGEVTGDALSADGFDCERYDYTIPTACQAAANKIAGGLGRPFIYSSTGADSPTVPGSNYEQLVAELATHSLAFGRDVDWIEAHYDNVPVLSAVPGAVGKQFQSTPTYDQSVVLRSWLFGLVPPARKEDPMQLPPILGPTAQPATFYSDPNALDQVAITFDAIAPDSPVPVTNGLRAVVHRSDGTDQWVKATILQGATNPTELEGDANNVFEITKGWAALVQVPVGFDMVSLRNEGPDTLYAERI